MATLPAATAITRTGVTVSGNLATAASTADKFANTGKQMLAIKNGDASPKTLTLITNKSESDQGGALTVQDPTISVVNGTTMLIGPFVPSLYNDSSGYLNYTLSDATSVTVTVLQFTAEAPTA